MGISEIDELNTKAWEMRLNDLRQSFDIAMKMKEASEILGYERGIADSTKLLGYCYWRFTDFAQSLTNSLQALKIYQQLQLPKEEANTLNSVGAVYMFQKDHVKRLECNLRCLKIRQEVKDYEGVASSQNNIGETYYEMGDHENALKWFYESLNNPFCSPQGKAWATHNLGKVYKAKNEFEKSKNYLFESLSISEAVSYQILICDSSFELALLFFDKKNYSKAEQYTKAALEVAEKIGSKEEMKNAFDLLAQIKERTDDTNEALRYYKMYHASHVEIFNEINTQRIRDIEFQYEIERITKEAEVERFKTVELRAANEETEKQKLLLEYRNIEIIDSIKYAQRIQKALLKNEKYVSKYLPSHFILYKPKDIVSGDFYWALEKNVYLYIAVADCTGHGVPGAFLTMLGTSYINEITSREDLPTPGQILDELRIKFVKELSADGITKDGMDISMIRINYSTGEIIWAGANNPLWIIKKDSKEVKEIRGDKQPIGLTDSPILFTNHELKLGQGDSFFLFTDGLADQFGGASGKKFMKKQLKELLIANQQEPMDVQKQKLNDVLESWKGDLEQVDDICLIGVKI